MSRLLAMLMTFSPEIIKIAISYSLKESESTELDIVLLFLYLDFNSKKPSIDFLEKIPPKRKISIT